MFSEITNSPGLTMTLSRIFILLFMTHCVPLHPSSKPSIDKDTLKKTLQTLEPALMNTHNIESFTQHATSPFLVTALRKFYDSERDHYILHFLNLATQRTAFVFEFYGRYPNTSWNIISYWQHSIGFRWTRDGSEVEATLPHQNQCAPNDIPKSFTFELASNSNKLIIKSAGDVTERWDFKRLVSISMTYHTDRETSPNLDLSSPYRRTIKLLSPQEEYFEETYKVVLGISDDAAGNIKKVLERYIELPGMNAQDALVAEKAAKPDASTQQQIPLSASAAH